MFEAPGILYGWYLRCAGYQSPVCLLAPRSSVGPEVQGTLRPIGCQVHRAWYLHGPTPRPHPTLAMLGSRARGWIWGAKVPWSVGPFGGMQEMELGVSFSSTVWHRVCSRTGHPSWLCQHPPRDRGAGHRGLLSLPLLPDCLVQDMGVHGTALSPLCQSRAVQAEGKIPWGSSTACYGTGHSFPISSPR